MAHLLVIGGASSDILHFAGQTATSAGGAGMYTAMAAHRSGMQVSLFGPRPSPIPKMLRPIAERLTAWHGQAIPPEELPHFEIAYHNGKTTYLRAFVDAESNLMPGTLPPDLSPYDCVHITPLGDVHRQSAFLQACRQRGARRISVGTGPFLVDEPNVVRSIMEQADIFFMNDKEAAALFGSVETAKTWPGKLLFVTLGERGAVVIQGDYPTEVPGVPSNVLDPTGAGDTFCGAALAHLSLGEHPVMAARLAMPVASQMIEHVGPTALLWPEPPPAAPVDARVVVDESRVKRVSQLIATLPEVAPFSFTGPDFPPVRHPAALDQFFASTLQQFSFWTHASGKYHLPLIAPLNGRQRKGSSYLYQAYLRPLTDDPEFYTPVRQADLTQPEMLALFRADDGSDPMPAVELHLAQAQGYGRDMLALGLTPRDVVEQAQASATPLQTFFELLDHIGGYKEDPLRKKSALLALTLNQRPEVFLAFGANEQASPVIDYHAQRFCLRVGLIDVGDETLRKELVGRQLLLPTAEWAVRHAAYIAVEQLVAASGKSAGAVDWFMFNSRKRCPEMTEPVCQLCQLDPVCAHRKELFQPVLRTTFY